MSSPDYESMLPLTEEEVDDCVFQMDSEPPSAPQAIAMRHQSRPYHILEAIVQPSTQVEIEVHERAMKHVREIGEERKRSSLKRRLMMRLSKDGYDASLCRTSWVASTEHPGGNYEYIDVVVHGAGADEGTSSSSSSTRSRLVVDIDFRSQFQLARPTPWYAQLWARLPAVFVGPRGKLRKAVSLLCEAAQRSLRESGLHVPPWRRSRYMQAKWIPGGGGPSDVAAVAAQLSMAIVREPSGGARRQGGAGGLSMALSGTPAPALMPDGWQQGQASSMWA